MRANFLQNKADRLRYPLAQSVEEFLVICLMFDVIKNIYEMTSNSLGVWFLNTAESWQFNFQSSNFPGIIEWCVGGWAPGIWSRRPPPTVGVVEEDFLSSLDPPWWTVAAHPLIWNMQPVPIKTKIFSPRLWLGILYVWRGSAGVIVSWPQWN